MNAGFGNAPWAAMPFGEALSSDDTTPPYIGNWSPFTGAVIGRLGLIEFDVTDDSMIVATVHVVAVFPAATEDVWVEGSGFTELYARGSVRSAIAGGFHYVMRRTTGWPDATVLLDVTATDLAGNVGTGHAAF
jgi:hypothetical protein